MQERFKLCKSQNTIIRGVGGKDQKEDYLGMDTEKAAEKRNPLAAQSAPQVTFIRPMSILLSVSILHMLSYQRCLSVVCGTKGV